MTFCHLLMACNMSSILLLATNHLFHVLLIFYKISVVNECSCSFKLLDSSKITRRKIFVEIANKMVPSFNPILSKVVGLKIPIAVWALSQLSMRRSVSSVQVDVWRQGFSLLVQKN